MSFKINQNLKKSTFLIKETTDFQVLLSKNSLITWFLLVPKTEIIEWYLLDSNMHKVLNTQICLTSRFLKEELKHYKINIATIGNVVEQMHIHIVGRNKEDCFWPDVVWGKNEFKEYDPLQFENLKKRFLNFI